MHWMRHLTPKAAMLACVAALLCTVTSSCSRNGAAQAKAAGGAVEPITAQQTELIHQGKLIFDETPKYASEYVGNKLACSDCHIQSGTAAYAAPMVNLAGLFPMFNKRAGRIISLHNRIQECFSRSEAGKPLPEDSLQMKELVAYIDWLSRDEVKGQTYRGRGFVKLPALTGDPVRGRAIYASQCAGCHGSDGAGVPPILPAVWGNDSYNDGAGMNNPVKMAAFVEHNMPQNHPGSLTSQQAYDVATYIHTMPRQKLNPAYKHY
jgi:thiosulfate dehydrogenase